MRSISFSSSSGSSVGRKMCPAPKKSNAFVAFRVFSRLSLGGNISAMTSNTPSGLTSPSAITTQFSVNNPIDVSHAVKSTRTVPVKSSM